MARALIAALALAVLLVAPAAQGIVRSGSGKGDRITGTNTRDLLYGARGGDSLTAAAARTCSSAPAATTS
jgi:hypothetical protein